MIKLTTVVTFNHTYLHDEDCTFWEETRDDRLPQSLLFHQERGIFPSISRDFQQGTHCTPGCQVIKFKSSTWWVKKIYLIFRWLHSWVSSDKLIYSWLQLEQSSFVKWRSDTLSCLLLSAQSKMPVNREDQCTTSLYIWVVMIYSNLCCISKKNYLRACRTPRDVTEFRTHCVHLP